MNFTEFFSTATVLFCAMAGGVCFIAGVWGMGVKLAYRRSPDPVPNVYLVMVRSGFTGCGIFFVLLVLSYGLPALISPAN